DMENRGDAALPVVKRRGSLPGYACRASLSAIRVTTTPRRLPCAIGSQITAGRMGFFLVSTPNAAMRGGRRGGAGLTKRGRGGSGRLDEGAKRWEGVLFLVSKAWLASVWCRKELNLAHSLNKPLFGVLIEDLSVGELPEDLAGSWQIVRLAAGRDHIVLRAVLPITHEEAHVHFSAEGLQRLKHGLQEAGLEAKYFAWPPQNDPDRPPYRGLRPLEAEDAGIFFGRDGPIVEALDRLRRLRETTPPRLLVILGASGAGKSSFLRAG